MVFDPDQVDLRMINFTARLILELCDGRTYGETKAQYCSLLQGRLAEETACDQFDAGVNLLLSNELISIGGCSPQSPR